MNFLDDERKIIELFQEVEPEEVYFPVVSESLEKIFLSIHEESEWEHWMYCAGKNDPPPDFYNAGKCLMMDLMRIDDHAYMNDKGKIINLTNAAESKLQKEIRHSWFSDTLPNCCEVIVIPQGTPNDHDYIRYLSNFRRIVEDHISKIRLYKQNHPGYKVVFFVMDESSAYYVPDEKEKMLQSKEKGLGEPHIFCMDQDFISIFAGSEIDYLIWFAPYKLIRTEDGYYDLPKVVVFDCHDMPADLIQYDGKKMKSVDILNFPVDPT